MNQHRRNAVQEIRMLYAALTGGMVFFILISLMIDFLGLMIPGYKISQIGRFLLISNLVALLILAFAFGYFKRQIGIIRKKELSQRFEQYKVSTLIRAAAIESAVFLFLIFYIYTSSFIFLIEALLVFSLILFLYPSNNRISKDIDV